MLSYHILRLLCVLGIILLRLGLTTADNSFTELEPFHGNRDLGGCSQNLQKLKEFYSQVIELSKAAIVALHNLKNQKPDDSTKAQEWDRQARMAKAMFGLDADIASGVIVKGMGIRRTSILSEAIVTDQMHALRLNRKSSGYNQTCGQYISLMGLNQACVLYAAGFGIHKTGRKGPVGSSSTQ